MIDPTRWQRIVDAGWLVMPHRFKSVQVLEVPVLCPDAEVDRDDPRRIRVRIHGLPDSPMEGLSVLATIRRAPLTITMERTFFHPNVDADAQVRLPNTNLRLLDVILILRYTLSFPSVRHCTDLPGYLWRDHPVLYRHLLRRSLDPLGTPTIERRRAVWIQVLRRLPAHLPEGGVEEHIVAYLSPLCAWANETALLALDHDD